MSIRDLIEQLEDVASIIGDGAPVTCAFAIESVTNHAGTACVNLGKASGRALANLQGLMSDLDDAGDTVREERCHAKSLTLEIAKEII